MTADQAPPSSIPLLQSSHEQAVKLRKRLEDVFGNMALVRDVVTVCVELGQANAGDFNREIAHVLQRCAADRLSFQMRLLNGVIERLGGKTALNEAKEVSR
jgi:hypothetical protein